MTPQLFTRQFLLSPDGYPELSWPSLNIGNHVLQWHSALDVAYHEQENCQAVLIGQMLDPHAPDKCEKMLLSELVEDVDPIGIASNLYTKVGRFVIIIFEKDKFTVFHDACGLRSVYYAEDGIDFFAASQPKLLGLVFPLEKTEDYFDYWTSDYVNRVKEHWVPCGYSLYNNVYQLKPNHYYRSGSASQTRYWPTQKFRQREEGEVLHEFVQLLQKTMIAARSKFNLSFPVTAGYDTRLILAACRDFSKEIWCYTLIYRGLNPSHNDVRIPVELKAKHHLDHRFINCSIGETPGFRRIYEESVSTPHWNDWGIIASRMYGKYPSEKVVVKGSCAEVGRCFNYHDGIHPEPLELKYLLETEFLSERSPFIRRAYREWLDATRPQEASKGYKLYDLFYWEQRMGGWQSQSQLEWDIIQEVFCPFNNREILDLMMSTDPKGRCKPNYDFYRRAIDKMWPELLETPINPKSSKARFRAAVRKNIERIGMLEKLQVLLKR